MNRVHCHFLSIAFLLYTVVAHATDPKLEEALDLIQSGQSDKALPMLYPLAAEGYVEAKIALGYYFLENGDESESLKWLNEAALSGISLSQTHLGLVLTDVIGRDEDISLGVEWLKKAGEQGDRIAAIKLAQIYRTGKGNVSKDIELYEYWNSKAQIY
jgi:TPR repeat protein